MFEERQSDGALVGFSDNYVKVAVYTSKDLSNGFADVRVTGTRERTGTLPFVAIGELIEDEKMAAVS